MIPTIRFIVLLATGALLVGFSGWSASLMTAGVAVICLDLVMAVGDCLRLGRAVHLDIERTCDDKLSLGAENPVRIRLRNSGYTHLKGAFRDEYPEGFEARGNVFNVDIPPRSEQDRLYHVTPTNRGDLSFGHAYIRLQGPLGMVMRQIRYPMERRVKVYPNLLDIKRYEIAVKREHAREPGQRVARVRGRGTDFESLRDYATDDEFRAVDWKASARRGKLVTRQYQQEKSQNVVVLLDCGRLMGPVIAGLTRLDHAINAAMMVAHVAAAKGDKVGMMAFAEDIIAYSPPRAGKSQTLSLLRLAYNLKNASGDSDYYRAIPYFSRRWTRRSLVVLFTDLVDPESSRPLIAQISSLTKKHLCLCVVMTDPAVREAAEGEVQEASDAYTAATALQVLKDRKLAAAQLARAGAVVLDVPPDKFTPSVVNEYLNIKGRGML